MTHDFVEGAGFSSFRMQRALRVAILGASLCACGASEALRPVGTDGGNDAVAPTPPLPPFDAGVLDPRVESSGGFPYAFVDDEVPEDYARFRAEGQPIETVTERLIDYLKKYKYKRRTAPSAEVSYFEAQRLLLPRLQTKDKTPNARLGLVGDIMWIGDSWDSFASRELLDTMQDHADAWLGNLESPIVESLPTGATLSGFPAFNSEVGLVRSLRNRDNTPLLSLVSFANNHTLDQGDEGARATFSVLEREKIPFTGAGGGRRYAELSVKGIRMGVYATTWGMNDPSWKAKTSIPIESIPGLAPHGEAPIDLSSARGALSEMARDGVALRVLLVHWGHEYELYPTPTQMIVARELVAAGADIIVGAHSHVPQPSEVCFVNGYEELLAPATPPLAALTEKGGCLVRDDSGRKRKALVLYSLGNFVTAMNTFLCQVGVAQSLPLFVAESGEVDWGFPSHFFVYNNADTPKAMGHSTYLLRTHIDASCGGSACPAETTDDLSLLRSMLGSELGLELQ